MERHQLIAVTPADLARARAERTAWVPCLLSALCCFYLAAIGILGVVVAGAPLVGLSATTVTSGSMRPALEVGDVVLARPAHGRSPERVEVGRVVTFRRAGTLVTHRVVERLPDGRLRTRGDGNREPDPLPVRPGDVVARPVLLVPMAGLPGHWMATRNTGALLGWTAATVAAVAAVARQRYRPLHRRRRHAARRLLPVALGAALVVGSALHARTPVAAVFTGGTSTGTNTLAAAELAAPTGLRSTVTCSLGVPLSVQLDWDPMPAAETYTLQRAVSLGDSFSDYQTTASTSYTEVSLGLYRYRVRSNAGPWHSPHSTSIAIAC